MDQRKGDVRAYIVSGIFFSCIVSGGIFLGLYMFLPQTQSSAWYPILGMILVSIPWTFWFFTFLYWCFKRDQPPPLFDSIARFSKVAAAAPPGSHHQHSMAAMELQLRPAPQPPSLPLGTPLVAAVEAAIVGFNLGQLFFW